MKFAPKDKPKREFSQSKNLVLASYLLVTSLTLLAWNSRFQASLKGFAIPSLLAMLAFGFMWVHYFAYYLKSNYEPDLDTRLSTKITQIFVLLAIFAHPIAIVLNLHKLGYGLPPASFKHFFGLSGELFVMLGSLSFLAFLAYEFKNYLKKRPKAWSIVLKLNDVAMLLIILHGFKLGFVINSTWFKYVWLVYGLSLLYFFYDRYILKRELKKYAEGFIVGLVVLMLIFIGLAVPGQSSSKSSQNGPNPSKTTTSSVVSLAELAQKDGLNGHGCWVAVNGTVYNPTNNPEWKNGEHTPSGGLAKCGKDLTEVIRQSPHGASVLEELPVVGKLKS